MIQYYCFGFRFTTVCCIASDVSRTPPKRGGLEQLLVKNGHTSAYAPHFFQLTHISKRFYETFHHWFRIHGGYRSSQVHQPIGRLPGWLVDETFGEFWTCLDS